MIRKKTNRSALTLLEMLIAFAMLIFGLGIVYQLLNVSRLASTGGEELAIVQLACQAKMNELLAMNHDEIPSGQTQRIANVKDWDMRVEVFTPDRPGVVGIRVYAVKNGTGSGGSEHRFELTRWKLAPTG